MKIIIDFDPVEKKVNSVTVEDTVATVTNKQKTKDLKEEPLAVELGDNKLILTQSVVDLLGAAVGDRLIVRYKENNGFIEPFLAKAEVFNESGGNKLTKGLTISFRGYQRESLIEFGTKFIAVLAEDGSVKLNTDNQVKAKPQLPKIEISTDPIDILMADGDSLDISTSLFQINKIN